MSTTRKANTSKKLRALKQGAEYGVAGAGATSMSLNAVALCLAISNPVILTVAGVIGTILCCIGGCSAYNEPDEQELAEENHKDLMQIKEGINRVNKDLDRHNQECKDSLQTSGFFSIASLHQDMTFTEESTATLFAGPRDFKMDEKKQEAKPIKRVASF